MKSPRGTREAIAAANWYDLIRCSIGRTGSLEPPCIRFHSTLASRFAAHGKSVTGLLLLFKFDKGLGGIIIIKKELSKSCCSSLTKACVYSFMFQEDGNNVKISSERHSCQAGLSCLRIYSCSLQTDVNREPGASI